MPSNDLKAGNVVDFEEQYFKETGYQGNYETRNPFRKTRVYVDKILEFKTSGKLLDAGCAFGNFLFGAKTHFACDGIDISSYAIKIAREKNPECNLEAKGLDQLTGTEGPYDVVTCFDVLEHISNIDKAFENLKNILAPGGLLVLTVPVYDGFFGKIVGALDKDETHVLKKDRNFWIDLLKENNFEILEHAGIFRYLFIKYYLHLFARSSKNYAPAIFVISRKRP